MTDAQTLMHIVSLFFFLAAAIIWGSLIPRLLHYRFKLVYRTLGVITAVAGVFISLLFIGLQIDWMVSHHNQAVGDVTSYLWLAWDYGAGVFLVALGLWSNANVELMASYCKDQFLEEPAGESY